MLQPVICLPSKRREGFSDYVSGMRHGVLKEKGSKYVTHENRVNLISAGDGKEEWEDFSLLPQRLQNEAELFVSNRFFDFAIMFLQ